MGMAQAREFLPADILVIGDPHAKKTNVPEIDDLTAKIKEVAKERKPHAIVILGDLANDFAKMHLQAWNAIVWMIKELSEIAPVIYIVGNHDALNNQIFKSEDHFFNAFKYWDLKKNPVVVVDKPMAFNIKDCKFMFIPYVPPGRFKECFEGFEHHDDIRAIFCHQEFRGAKMGAVESKFGDLWLPDSPLVISGHIHDRQVLQDNLIYVGTPYYTSFGDSGDKTVSLFHFPTNLETAHKEELIDLGMPKKKTLKMTVEKAKKWKAVENTSYRLYVEDTTEEIAKFKKTKSFKNIKQVAKVIFKPTDKVVAKRNVSNEGYMTLLQKAIKDESQHVKDAFDEVTGVRAG